MESSDDELIARLFAMLTAKFEDAATIAASGQARDVERGKLLDAASSLATISEEAATLIRTVEALLGR